MNAIEEKKTKPPDKSNDYFKCVKVPLKHVLKNYDITPTEKKNETKQRNQSLYIIFI